MTLNDLQQLVEYKDGELFWKVSRGRVAQGDRVGNPMPAGYWQAQIDGERWYIHRLVFFLHHGYVPKYIDHIDGDRSNNAIENLRECTQSENIRNSKVSKRNTSGVKGVAWDRKRKKWCAQLNINGRETNLGRYITLEEAKAVVEAAREQHHGEFARQN